MHNFVQNLVHPAHGTFDTLAPEFRDQIPIKPNCELDTPGPFGVHGTLGTLFKLTVGNRDSFICELGAPSTLGVTDTIGINGTHGTLSSD